MTYGKRQFENLDFVMRKLIPPFHQAMNELLGLVDADSAAFNGYMVSTSSSHPTAPPVDAPDYARDTYRLCGAMPQKVIMSVSGGAENAEVQQRGEEQVSRGTGERVCG